MSVAVVVPLFNGRPWIGDALRSVGEQTLAPEEVVVVDDGSTDGSTNVVREFDGVRLAASDTKGGAAARNTGIRLTSATRVAFLDQDDVWHRDHLRVLSAALDEHREAPGAVTSCVSFSGSRAPTLHARRGYRAPLDPWQLFPLTNPIPTPSSVLVRRTALEAVGGFDNALRGIADYHLWLRLSTTRPFVRLAARTVGRRTHDTSESAGLLRSGYLELHQRVAHAAVGPDQGRQARRCRAFDAAADMTRAVAAGRHDTAAAAARELERQVADEPDTYVEAVFDRLVWLHCGGSPRRRLDLLASYDAVWPADAKRTRRALASPGKAWRLAARGQMRKAGTVLRLLYRRLRH